jgi:SNF2 family DNA or RNA helicase
VTYKPPGNGFFPFQVEGISKAYLKLLESDGSINPLLAWDTGIGKSALALAIADLGFQDGEWDRVLLCAERNKLDADEWPKDLSESTDFGWCHYHGDKKKRTKLRDELPQVVLSTYETIKIDCAKKDKVLNQKGREVEKIVPGPFTESLIAQGSSVLIIYDEMTKLGNRKSGLYKHHECMISALRKAGVKVRILGLTATPIERGVENYFNIGRLIYPSAMPTVVSFERDYVATKDLWGNYSRFKNLNEDDHVDADVIPFADLMRPVLLRKRKTDPDVIDQFPRTMEEPPLYVHLGDRHQEFYETVKGEFEGCDEATERMLFTVMRQIAGHPCSVLLSEGKVAKVIADAVGEPGLRALGAAKCDRLVSRLEPIVKGQGAQVVVFSFFTSVIPFIQEALESVKPNPITVATYTGKMGNKARQESKAEWKAGNFEVLLSSDAGARGINLPEGQYALEYEMALTHSNRLQRLNRIHRIDSKHPAVTFQSFIALDTVEEGIANGVLRRNEWSDTLLDDDDPGENFITAKQRKKLLKIARRAAA